MLNLLWYTFQRIFSVRSERAMRFALYSVVGGIGVLLNTFVLHMLTADFHVHYMIAAAIATECAIIANFFGNNFLTFNEAKRSKSLLQRLATFQAISLSTLAVSLSIIGALTTLFGLGLLLVWNLVAIAVSFLLNFELNSRITWPQERTDYLH